MKRVRSSFNATSTLTQLHEFELNSPLPSGTSDTVSISKNNNYNYDDDEGVALQLSITLSASTQEVTLDLLAGELDEVALKDPFGNAVTFDVVNLIVMQSDGAVDFDAADTNGFVNCTAGIGNVNYFILESVDGWAVESDNNSLTISAVETLTGDDEIVVKLLVVGKLLEESSSA
jgi:hypothetical protein